MVFDLILADVKIIIGDTAVFDSFIMVGDIPFFGDIKAVRKHIDNGDDPAKKVPALFKAFIDDCYRILIGIAERLDLQTHRHHGIDIGRICRRIDVMLFEIFRGIHLPKPCFKSGDLLLNIIKTAFFQSSSIILFIRSDRFFRIHISSKHLFDTGDVLVDPTGVQRLENLFAPVAEAHYLFLKI